MSLYLYGGYPQGGKSNASLFRDDLCNLRDWMNAEPLFNFLNFDGSSDLGREIQIGGQTKQKAPSHKGLMTFNMAGCKPENIQVDIKDGTLHVESKEEHEGGFRFIRYERTIPKDVDPNALKASLLPDGTLQFKLEEKTTAVPITHEKK